MVELDDRIVKGKKAVMEMILEACESGKILKVKADYGNETPVPPGQNHSFNRQKASCARDKRPRICHYKELPARE